MRHLSEKMSSRLQCCSRHVAQGRACWRGVAVCRPDPLTPSASGFVLCKFCHLRACETMVWSIVRAGITWSVVRSMNPGADRRGSPYKMVHDQNELANT